MNILSLFDGMACGMLAFQKAGVTIDTYTAYEIDKYAIQTATHNFPNIKECGDVFEADFTQYKNIDYIVGGSPCFTEGHLVLTDKGYKDIAKIEIGDNVLTHKNRFMPVVRTYKKESPTVNLKITGYPVFTTTSNHPFYTIKKEKVTWKEYTNNDTHSWRKFTKNPEWVKAKDLSKEHFCGQHIAVSQNINDYNIDEELAYILGRYVADGCVYKAMPKENKKCRYNVILSIGKDKLDSFKSKVTKRHFCCTHSNKTDSVYQCIFYSKELVDFILEQGFGDTAYTKCIPEFVFNLPLNIRLSFLDGYISGDGCYIKSYDEYSLTTVSPKLAFGLQRLIVGIYTTNVSVCISDNNRIHKIENREIKSNYPLYTILFKKEIRKQTVAHIQDSIVWTQVKSIESTGNVETVYNIEVAEDHSYTINNCIVKNCTYWSIAQKNNRETEASGMGWELFSQYVRAIKEVKPKFFIYENNKSMSAAIRQSISETFGFEPICINSALVSAQNRQRLYWVGKRNDDGMYSKVDVNQPEDKGILLKDILDTGCDLTTNDKAWTLTASYNGAVPWNTIERSQRNMVVEPVNITNDEKSRTIKAQYQKTSIANICCYSSTYGATGVAEPVCIQEQVYERKIQDDGTYDRRYEARQDGKSGTLTSTMRQNAVAEPDGTTKDGKSYCLTAGYSNGSGENIGNYAAHTLEKDCKSMVAEPIRVGALPRPNGELSTSQAMRVYSTEGKSVNLVSGGGGMGGKTGLYAIPVEFKDDKPTKAISCADGKTHTVYDVKDGQITIKGKQYPIKLVDGYYIIRKLTVSECKRLQTVPEWYEFPVSDTQAYKMLGNSWTVDVIVHLIEATLK